MRTSTLFSSLVLAAMIAPTAVAGVPVPSEVAPDLDATEHPFIPLLTKGEITSTTVTNSVVSGAGAVEAHAEYGHYRLEVRVIAHYRPQGTFTWVQEEVCTRAVEQTDLLGEVRLSASCSGVLSRTPHSDTDVAFCAEGYLYRHMEPTHGWVGEASSGECSVVRAP